MKLFEGVIAMLNSIIHGDCLEVLMTLEDNSMDSIVTDPPYELGFMGKSWDSTGIAYNVELWKECLRVLKPGGHLLAFGGTRTYHRMACAIEDAGFEIRDCIQWIYGSGFPKSQDISKAIDKKLGSYPRAPEAQQWEGWGTCLKPANEPIVLARKPLSEKTIAENVLKWGTGGLNIDGCRIPTEDNLNGGAYAKNGTPRDDGWGMQRGGAGEYVQPTGRFPANVILDEEAGRMLDEQSGISKSRASGYNWGESNNDNPVHVIQNIKSGLHYDDKGGASRFFYCAKASKKERNMGLEDVEPTTVDDGRNKPIDNPFLRGKTPRRNTHPTVKPVKLMEYLITLITPPNGIVLDPFLGSGTTALAALNLGRFFIGIELNEEYCEIARRRVASHTAQQGLKFA